jgi:hypothetical protein
MGEKISRERLLYGREEGKEEIRKEKMKEETRRW